MPINITMPALSPTMEEGNLAKWLVKEGDTVKSGDVIAEIETDKATMEVEAVDEGVVAKIVVAAGTEGVKVNALIAILAAEGEDVSAAAAGGGASAPAKAEAPKGEAPKAEAPAAKADAPAAAPQAAPQAAAPAAASGDRVFSSPLARRLAKEAGLDLKAISGTGPKGRVVKSDVEKAVSTGGAKPAAAPAASGAAPAPALAKGMSDDAVLKLFAEGSYELVPHDGMRKTIAKRLQESKQTIPHFYVSVDCELDALLALRAQLNTAAPEKDGKPVYKLSVNDMVIKAMALALRDVPDANVSWTDTNMVKHKHADVGVAVSIPGGLITPIIRQAELKSLSAISNEMKDLGARAKSRKLKPEEYQGGTTAVSNMGMMGVKNFAAVVNPPHATILAVGAGEERVVVKKGEMKIANVMTVTLSTDHRAVDGALGAELLGAFKRYIENPMGMLV
ncbi:pyruvate dehydrogenase complex dihydrolipoamide acetyltransferase [Agrobacterium vitis]|uniref:Acetyltransferase component of pyruvate dehydrogenase complex n=1 Tax=Agrobacterium vitis TaxID=373 RepID=A0AAE5AV97_AGRVI|nr:pyruvate dehydrogenase complex dihydrolipoamide acetyltransferase [Agrobacterium vitis]MCF1496688.1 pyruvate dehydrogenase complex dihydrolipoamide acetyltransferase [Allorhizobium sp. Av2]MCM2439764.1 pyruvate dehydrogenase complex dihydrolipoamide acetyltransferase [Agrobacterium vitis]MUZ57339.1 pyruvate dehydrogenase complex dihydrolipoamide acetyltransferase [Agrobacterium vitis]MVA65648.1 pyruvate dehydrogenase complex dihydrolipoamide acetyltransferase [Agrobacterium vitis]MVA86673.1